jgi:hypothetical protein
MRLRNQGWLAPTSHALIPRVPVSFLQAKQDGG